MGISSVVNRIGLNSIAYFNVRRTGKLKLGELTLADLNSLSRFIDPVLVDCLKTMIPLNGKDLTDRDRECIIVRNRVTHLAELSAKSIRANRTNLEPICLFKSGAILMPKESLTYFFQLSKLSSVRHKNILLRIIHGDIYTKERLFRFGLVENPTCPRCNALETLEHKFVTCEYTSRIWTELERLIPVPFDQTLTPIQNRLLANGNNNLLLLTVHAEILNRISLLKPDANYLIRPRIMVLNSLRRLLKLEKNQSYKRQIESLLLNS